MKDLYINYLPYFYRTAMDARFYEDNIKPRLPESIFDIHVHLNLPEHVANVPAERLKDDWALECAHILTVEDAYRIFHYLLPEVRYSIAGFPMPIQEADIRSNNTYLGNLKRKGKIYPFMSVRPEWDIEDIEYTFKEYDFVGFKPYPDVVSGKKGSDISIFDFMPHRIWNLADRLAKAVMLHLPRKGRFADKENLKELLLIKEKYPHASCIIAHFGRSFCPIFLKDALSFLGENTKHFYFDVSGVFNPEVFDLAFDSIPSQNICYGSDLPIFLWHGKREWTTYTYKNYCRESFSWKPEDSLPEKENKYTLMVYNHLKVILDTIDKHSYSFEEKMGFFKNNAVRILKI